MSLIFSEGKGGKGLKKDELTKIILSYAEAARQVRLWQQCKPFGIFIDILLYAVPAINLHIRRLFFLQEFGDENDSDTNKDENQSEAEDEATRLHHDDGHDDDKEAPIVSIVVLHEDFKEFMI